MKLEEALPVAKWLARQIEPFCNRVAIAGSIRRLREEVGDIELVCISKRVQTGLFHEDITVHPDFIKTIDKWKTDATTPRGEATGRYARRYVMVNGYAIQVDVFMTTPEIWGEIYAIRTGSADFAHYVLAKTWVSQGWTSVSGVLVKDGVEKSFPEEEDLFSFLGINWIPPEARDEAGEKAKVKWQKGAND